MKHLIAALTLTCALLGAAHMDGQIIEKRNAALAETWFVPKKTHDARTRIRLAAYWMRLAPFVAQSFDGGDRTLGLGIRLISTAPGSFASSKLVITTDGKKIGAREQSWDTSTGTEETDIRDAGLIRQLASARQAYITVLLYDVPLPFGQVSFKLTAEQLEDVRMMVGKYDSLAAKQ